MHKIQFNYSLRNIGLPSHHQYQRRLIEKTESVVQRMRWKAHYFLNGETNTKQGNKFGLPSKNCAPPVSEMKAFEEDVIHMISNIKFKKVEDPFLNNVAEDLEKINSSKNVLIFADKTRNIYETTPERYDKLLTENITKTYKLGNENLTHEINSELKTITSNLSIADRVDTMAKRNAFVTLKDHKENFDSSPKCRLINPSKSELGKVSKVILDNINNDIRSTLKVNQWKNSQSVIDWFRSINNKPNHTFLSFDIVEFYPSISENLLDRVISWAKTLTEVTEEHISIIKHARKSLLFYDNRTWVKQNNESLFDVTMGSYDGAEICELVGLFILNKLSEKFGKENVGLYRDDGLMLLNGTSGRSADKARKVLHSIFHQLDLKITAEVNHHTVNFLDITLNLKEEKFYPYRKPNNDPLYIDSRSNHPPSIIKQLPKSISKRVSTLSSDESCFKSAIPYYENALNRSNYNVTLQYSTNNAGNNPSPNRKNRQRKVIWFNPPYSKNVKTNVARNFLHLIDKHFPKSSRLHKIFNRNTVKVSYSCMNNIKSTISNHNRHLLEKRDDIPEERGCNCRVKDECPLAGKCLTKSLVYKAEITTTDDGVTKQYIGMTAGTFKKRFANHKKSLNNLHYSTETELSKYAWNLKQSEREFAIKWSIVKCVPACKPGGKSCNLCLEEKLCLLKSNNSSTLNRRSELFAKCRHRNKFSAQNFKTLNARASKLKASANRYSNYSIA